MKLLHKQALDWLEQRLSELEPEKIPATINAIDDALRQLAQRDENILRARLEAWYAKRT